jgi:hypothetical protein
MALVNVSLDTVTRQVVLTVNGILVSATDVSIDKYTYDEEEHINFGYTIENIDGDGMKKRVHLSLPATDELAAVANQLDENGLSSKVIDDEKTKAALSEFLQKRLKP